MLDDNRNKRASIVTMLETIADKKACMVVEVKRRERLPQK
jgi:hypothetical protein